MTLDAYAMLGVAPDAPQEDLDTAYRARLLLLHPDRMAGRSDRERETAAAMLADVQTAWSLVGDARSRARYERERTLSSAGEDLGRSHAEPAPGPARGSAHGSGTAKRHTASSPRLPAPLRLVRSFNRSARHLAAEMGSFRVWAITTPVLAAGWFLFTLAAESYGFGAGGAIPFVAGALLVTWWALVGVHELALSLAKVVRRRPAR